MVFGLRPPSLEPQITPEVPPQEVQQPPATTVTPPPGPVPTPPPTTTPVPTTTPTPPTPVFELVPWAPEQPQSVPGGVAPIPAQPVQPFDPVEAATKEFTEWVETYTSLYDNNPGGYDAPGARFTPLPIDILQGSTPEDAAGATGTMFSVYKNLEALLAQSEAFDPEAFQALMDSRVFFQEGFSDRENPLDPTSSEFSTGSVPHAFFSSLKALTEEHPDNPAQFLNTDEGFSALWADAQLRLLTPVSSGSVPGFFSARTDVNFAKPITDLFPDHPFLNVLASTLETMGDPGFLAATMIFPPAGIAAKTKLLATMAAGMAVGEEAAESVGLPGVVGALPGAVLGPAALGLTRAGMLAALRKARIVPVLSNPSTELLIKANEIPRDMRHLRQMTGEATLGPPGSIIREVELGAGEIKQGRHVLQSIDSSGNELGRLEWRESLPVAGDVAGESTIQVNNVVAHVERQGVGTSLVTDLLDEAAARGITRFTGDMNSTGGINLFARFGAKFENLAGKALSTEKALAARVAGKGVTMEMSIPRLPGRLPAVSGGSTGPSIEGFREKIFAHIERPEARDFLRATATKVADTVPLGRNVQELVNRLAVADDPALKAAFGWQFQLAEDTAARFMTMASFRGARWPFSENAIGQTWVPNIAGKGKRALGNLFRGGDGEWIATSDLFESVLRGEKTYLERLTAEQRTTIKKAWQAIQPYVSTAEKITGQTIRRAEIRWPRLAVAEDKTGFTVSSGSRGGKPSSLFRRQFEIQQEAIQQFGVKYQPSALNVMDSTISSLQRMGRDSLMGRYMREEGILQLRWPRLNEASASDLGVFLKGAVSKTNAREILNIIGPGTRNPAITVPQKINGVARMMLTGTLDTGQGAIQLVTLAASPAGPKSWAEAMGRGLYTAIRDPKHFYRWMVNSEAARRYALYGGDLGMSSEMMEAARVGGLGIPRFAPGTTLAPVSTAIDVATFLPRSFINRMQIGFDASLSYGRVLAFDAMADAASKPGLLARVAGAKPLSGKALHDELFRLSRFTDTLIGQPKLGGVITARQHQVESAFVWFATRYTRSLLGTLSYTVGKGYTPAQARATMAKMLIGGHAMMAGLIEAHGLATGKSQKEIFSDIAVALNPGSGKKYMSMRMGNDWYGLGGTYRAAFALVGGLANKDNWDFENFEDSLWNNPLIRGLRSRTSPITGTLADFVQGEDFMGYPVKRGELLSDPRGVGLDYLVDKFAPITLDALLNEGGHLRKGSRFLAEFFGLRTSPETAFEALEPVLNRVSQNRFKDENGAGIPWEGLENNLPAQDFVRSHPDVVALTEGRVRPIREREVEKFWRQYREGREEIRETHITTRERAEDSYTSGRMNGSDYREQYGESRANEFFELRGFREGLGVDFDDRGEAPAGTVNAALDAYYSLDLDDYRDKDTQVPDWEAYFADRDAALALTPTQFMPVVEEWLTRRETEVRRDMRTRFESVVEPTGYFRMREYVAVSLEVSLDDLESSIVQFLESRDIRSAPADVARLTDRVLNNILKDVIGDNAPTISKLRSFMREQNPALDAELFRQGFTTTVRSQQAQILLQHAMETRPDMGYFNADLATEIADRLAKERK